MGYTDPASAEEWCAAGDERRSDATVLRQRDRELAAYYFFAFAAECFAKAHIAVRRSRPAGGHHLLYLLEEAGIRPTALRTDLRACAERRDVSVRYQAEWPDELDREDLERMVTLMTWIRIRARREMEKKRRRRNTGRLRDRGAGRN